MKNTILMTGQSFQMVELVWILMVMGYRIL